MNKDESLPTYFSYCAGFILSLACTLFAFYLVSSRSLSSKNALVAWVAALALIQFVTQLLLFLHLGKESAPRFRLLVFGFMVSVVLLIIGGSIWIMLSLNYRMDLSPGAVNKYIKSQNGGF